MRLHPLAHMFPPLPTDDMEGLVASIAEHGMQTPILCVADPADPDGTPLVLDGKARLSALERLGEPMPSGELVIVLSADTSEAELRDRVCIANAMRRHLITAERALIAAGLTNLGPVDHDDAPPADDGADLHLTIGAAAKLMMVSPRMVKHARRVLRSVHARDLVPAIERGDLALDVAADAVFHGLVPRVLEARTSEHARQIVHAHMSNRVSSRRPSRRDRPSVFDYFPSTSTERPELAKKFSQVADLISRLPLPVRARFRAAVEPRWRLLVEAMAAVENVTPEPLPPRLLISDGRADTREPAGADLAA